MKKSIHFILPGGGVKGCFQAGFLYRLFKTYGDYFDVYKIDGCSVGSLNGLAVSSGNVDKLKEIWTSITSMKDLFTTGGSPGLQNIVSFYNGFYKKGFYQNKNLRKMVESNLIQEINLMEKFNCVVTNIEKGEFQYINGENEKIRDYVLASSTPWILSPPMVINNETFTDGALLQTYPVKNIEDSKADIKLIVGYDMTQFQKQGKSGDNLVFYLARIIDICRLNNKNLQFMENLINSGDVMKVINPVNVDFIRFDKEVIKTGFLLGEISAIKFAFDNIKIDIKDSQQLLFSCV